MTTFLDTFHAETPQRSPDLTHKTAKQLLTLQNIIDYFIDTFSGDRLTKIPKLTSSTNERKGVQEHVDPDPKRAPDLSPTERCRLTRAFLHLELYGHLFLEFQGFGHEDFARVNMSLFLSSLPRWEIEELLCVRTFLVEKLDLYLKQVEDDFIERFQEEEPHFIEPDQYNNRWKTKDRFFSDHFQSTMQKLWLEGCLTRGLGTLRKMLMAGTRDERSDALGSKDAWCSTMKRALSTMYLNSGTVPNLPQQTSWEDTSTQEKAPNYGVSWLLSIKNPGTLNPFDRDLNVKREWGYAFWDRGRLDVLAYLPKLLVGHHVSFELSRSSPGFDDDVPGCRSLVFSPSRPSVETRTRRLEEIWKGKGPIAIRNIPSDHRLTNYNTDDETDCDTDCESDSDK